VQGASLSRPSRNPSARPGDELRADLLGAPGALELVQVGLVDLLDGVASHARHRGLIEPGSDPAADRGVPEIVGLDVGLVTSRTVLARRSRGLFLLDTRRGGLRTILDGRLGDVAWGWPRRR
jgi:hypothetical protein